jgi:protein-disulfide isomerase
MDAAADSGDSLGSAPPPPLGPGDHVRGEGPEAILYLDLACPRCAATWPRVSALPLRLCVRHFPLASKRPRSPALHAAAEAAALHSEAAFWAFWDSLLADRSRVDDPHLWERAEALGIDPADFDRERRSERVAARVRSDFRSGIRAGVVSTPAAFAGGAQLPGEVADALAALAGAGSD